MNAILSRLKEPSTWAGIAVIATGLAEITPAAPSMMLRGVSALAGGLAMLLRERGGAQ